MFSLKSSVHRASPTLKTLVRFAGGGGRPGGKPAFNWKEKKILGLDKKSTSNHQFKLRPYGRLEDIKDFVSEEDVILPFDGKEKNFDQTVLAEAIIPGNDRKVVNIKQLFGSNKPFGTIPKKSNVLKLGFSYQRVFGEKHRKLKEEKKLAEAAAGTSNPDVASASQ